MSWRRRDLGVLSRFSHERVRPTTVGTVANNKQTETTPSVLEGNVVLPLDCPSGINRGEILLRTFEVNRQKVGEYLLLIRLRESHKIVPDPIILDATTHPHLVPDISIRHVVSSR